MKDKFNYYGLQSPIRREIYLKFRNDVYKPTTEEELILWTKLLWSQPFREYQYCSMDELEKSKKLIGLNAILHVEQCLTIGSWWDTVDMLASNILGGYYKDKPIESLHDYAHQHWINSPDMWLNRTAILVQLKYKTNTSLPLLNDAIKPHLNSNEFFHQKAIGWALREYAKTDKNWVKEYIKNNELKPLSKREAMKHM